MANYRVARICNRTTTYLDYLPSFKRKTERSVIVLMALISLNWRRPVQKKQLMVKKMPVTSLALLLMLIEQSNNQQAKKEKCVVGLFQ